VDEFAGKDDVRDIAGSLVGATGARIQWGETSQNARRLVEVEQARPTR
jgi:hypothetical protein